MHEPSNVTQDRPRLPLFTNFILPQLILCLVVASRPPPYSVRLATWVGLIAILFYSLRYDTGEGPFQNYLMGNAFATVSFTALWLLMTDPLSKYRYETQTKPLADMSLWEKIYNIQCISSNTRGIGWSYQIPHVRLPKAESRGGFVSRRSLRILRFLLLTDLAQTYIDLNPVFSLPEDQAMSLRSQGVLLQFLSVLAYATKSYCVLTVPYDVIAVAAVALGFSEPKAWPTVVGRWRDAYTLRRFWGDRVWQQMMRRFVAAGGKFAARTLRCAPGTWFSFHVQLFIGFTLSGLAHVPGDAMVHPKWTGSSFWFFPVQAVAITAEDFVIARGRGLGIRDTRWTRLVGYLWTAGWLTYSVPWFIDWAVKAGLARDRLAFQPSVVRPALEALYRATGVDVAQWVMSQCTIATAP